MPKQLRILYAIGPENVIEAYTCWKQNRDSQSQVSIPLSSQFFDVCKDLNAKGYVIAQSQTNEIIEDDRFRVECRRVPLPKASGILYYLRQLWCGLQLLKSAILFRANVVVVDSGTTDWYILCLFSWLGFKVVPSLHCTLWYKFKPLRKVDKLRLKINRYLFSDYSEAILVGSQDTAKQVHQLTNGQHGSIYEFNYSYRRSDFANLAQPSRDSSVFRVLFAGRIETNKGVFDLLEIAKDFIKKGIENIVFDVCGDGSALESLRLAVKEAGIERTFICHGYCQKQHMREIFGRSHIVVVPTRTDFSEGFNRVVCESILSNRPVVTSAVCPALSYVKEAVVEVPPNDVKAYGDAILNLYKERELYEQKRLACKIVQEQFYDLNKGWGAALKSVLFKIQQTEAKYLTTANR
ncbi:MAG: glycosyltransferase family 4 protein [Cyanobacteria bacterium P01_C01_bin.38]